MIRKHPAWSAFDPRLQLLVLCGVLAVGLATLTRVLLTAMAWSKAGLSSASLLPVFACGALYDVCFALYLATPFALLLLLPARAWRSRACRLLVWLALLAYIALLGFIAEAEVVFFVEFATRFNFIAVDYLIYTTEVLANIWQSYNVVWLLAADAALAAIVCWFLRARIAHLLGQPAASRPLPALMYAAAITLVAVAVDQGPRAAFGNPYAAELASNGPYQFFAAFRNNELDYEQFYPTLPLAEVDRLLRAEVAAPNARFLSDVPLDLRRHIDNPGPTRKLNVVLIMVESLSADYMGHFGDTRGITPYLDRLAGESLSFEQFYASGTRTVRGLEAVTLSVPPTPGRSIVKRIGRESGLWSLGAVLDQAGYASSFVYGGRAYFDNMGAFFAGNGYAVIDQSATPSEEIGFANAWGMADEDLYRQASKLARASQANGQPFFMHIMTTSNHRPYTFPEGRISLPQGRRSSAVRYTDWAIEDFIEHARREPWFDDTLFVILGDHCASSAGKVDLPAAKYHIPLIIYAPKYITPRQINRVTSQIDVAPTLLGLLGIDYDSAFLGQDLLAADAEAQEGRAVIGNYQYLGLIEDAAVTVLGPRNRITRHAADGRLRHRIDRAPRMDDPLVRRAIALYQGASYIYAHGLNAWQTTPSTATTVAAALAPTLRAR